MMLVQPIIFLQLRNVNKNIRKGVVSHAFSKLLSVQFNHILILNPLTIAQVFMDLTLFVVVC